MKPITYLALGDSLTEGVGAARPDSCFAAQYFRHIKVSERCRMRNMGISGLTSLELYSLIETPAIRKLLPRVSHITITTGGCDFIDWYESGRHFMELVRTMRRVRAQVEQLLQLVRQANDSATIYMLGFYLPLPAYEMGFLLGSRVLRSVNRAYREICKKNRVQLIDPFDSFLHRRDFFFDEVHPNQQGYDALARLFIQAADRGDSSQHDAIPSPEPLIR
ncbi:SGNH/GDSL hydrolase family protein [Paludifilum halophilum]|uniref:SGNH hydrolase-type esterase domain-containing protein n=1 Tax=Paludifilum halophilum TaxID=1642702 RepID=A0A235BAN4_9BACL|nr:GDSL-type esterase/lipase family protein [Paludifilum halophilum]OYD08937.1 hypothetical protein CHM34_03935 [Paludifilum halophilum]